MCASELLLSQRVSMENDSLVAERERMLLEELESLRRDPAPGRERLLRELRNSSTQTQVKVDFDFPGGCGM